MYYYKVLVLLEFKRLKIVFQGYYLPLTNY